MVARLVSVFATYQNVLHEGGVADKIQRNKERDGGFIGEEVQNIDPESSIVSARRKTMCDSVSLLLFRPVKTSMELRHA